MFSKAIILGALASGICLTTGANNLLLQNGTIHTVTSGDIKNGDVLIEDGRIVSVGVDLSDPDAEVIDLEGRHLYPGLILATTALGLVEIQAVRATRDSNEVGDYTPDVLSWTAVNPDSELIPVARANGITHVVPVPFGGIVGGMSGVVSLHGWTIEDMAIKKPAALHLYWPGMDLDPRPKTQLPDQSKWKSLEDQAKERTEKLKEIDDFFTEAETYARSRSHNQLDLVPAWEAMLPFVNGEIPLMIHADEYRQIKSAIEWTRDRKYKTIIAGGRDAWMLAEELAETGIPVVFERLFNQSGGLAATPARDVDPYDVHFSSPSVLHKAGVKVILSEGLGGDAATNARNLPYAAAQAIAFGFDEEAALRSITLHPAEILGVASSLGSIESGKEATLFVSDGDIFDIRSNVTAMWIKGEAVDLSTRHTRLYEKYKNRPLPTQP